MHVAVWKDAMLPILEPGSDTEFFVVPGGFVSVGLGKGMASGL
jgi:hypothetical protein